MGTATLATLRDRLSIIIGDYIHSTVTTALAASKVIVDTGLAAYTSRDNHFNRWWALITSQNNDGENRKVSDYGSSATTLTVLGANFTSDGANLATYELHVYDPTNKKRAINNAARELYPLLFKRIEWDDTLVYGNHLPNPHFEDFATADTPDYWTASTVTDAEENTTILGGTSSLAVTRAGSDGYVYCSEVEWPRLLNLADNEVDFYCWVKTSVASQAYIEIVTTQADGTTQTLTSDAHSGGGEWERLELEDQPLNAKLATIQFRLKVLNTDGTVYFDKARATGPTAYEYLLPLNFQEGRLIQVLYQTTGNSNSPLDIVDDVFTSRSQVKEIYDWTVFEQEGIRYLRTHISLGDRKLILVGYVPLEDSLSDDDDTMTIDDPHTNLLVAYAAYKLFELELNRPGSEPAETLLQRSAYWLGQSEFLKRRLKMIQPPSFTRFKKPRAAPYHSDSYFGQWGV